MMLAVDSDVIGDARELSVLIQSEEGFGNGGNSVNKTSALEQALGSLAVVTDSNVAERDLCTIRELTCEKELCEDALRRDGIELVLGTLAGHASSSGVTLQGLGALRNLARAVRRDCSETDDRNPLQPRISASVVAQVLAAIGAHGLRSSELGVACQVAEAGLAALCAVVSACGSRGEAEALEAGAIPRILEALAAHSGKPAVAREGLSVLGTLVRSEAGEAEAVRAGSLRHVFNCLTLVPDDARVAEAGLGTLLDLTFGPEGEAEALGAGAIGQVLRILGRFGQDDARVADVALGTLRNLVDSDKGRDEALDLNALKHTLDALRAHSGKEGDARVGEAGIGVLRNLCDCARGRAEALEQNALAHIIIALEAFPEDTAVAEMGCGALRNLAIAIPDDDDDEEVHDDEKRNAMMGEFSDLGALEHVLRCLRRHPTDRGVVEAGIGAVQNITDHEEGIATAMRCEALGDLMDVLAGFPNDESVRALGLRAVRNITGGEMGIRDCPVLIDESMMMAGQEN